MKKSILIISLLLVVSLPLLAIFDDYEPSVRARGMSGAYTAVSDNYEGVFYNPAGISLASNSAGSSIANLFGNSFSTLSTVAVNYKTSSFGTVSFAYEEMGVEYEDVNLSSEKTFTLAHAVCLNKDVNSELYFGYSANLYNLHYDELGSESTFGFNTGVIAILHNRTRIGFAVQNLNNPKIGVNNEHKLPQRLSAGIAYIPYQGVTTALDIKKTWTGDSEYRFGTEIEVTPMLTLRAGVRNNPVKYAFGFGLKPFLGINFDYAYDYHSVLNPTHHFGLSYIF